MFFFFFFFFLSSLWESYYETQHHAYSVLKYTHVDGSVG